MYNKSRALVRTKKRGESKMAYKDKSLKVISIRISDDCSEKLNRLWIDLRYSSKQRFSREVFEKAIEGIFEQVYKNQHENSKEAEDK